MATVRIIPGQVGQFGRVVLCLGRKTLSCHGRTSDAGSTLMRSGIFLSLRSAPVRIRFIATP